MRIERDVTEECRACGGAGFWMAPVYHNERVREACSACHGSCRRVIATKVVQSVAEPFPKAVD